MEHPVRQPARRPAARAALAAGALLLAAALAGCSGSDDSGGAAGRQAAPSASPSPSASSTPGTGPYPDYVALGDSYTAAPGVPESDGDDGCLRSTVNYPHLVAADLGSALRDVSCSGADSTALVGVQTSSTNKLVPAQFDALDDGTDLVTVGMGGNDFGLFASVFSGCVSRAQKDPQGSPCSDAGRTKALAGLKQIEDRLEAVYAGVRDRAPKAVIVAVGYPMVVPASGTCPDRLPLASGDYPFVREVNEGLNDAVRTAAKKAGVLYADVAKATEGHDVCATEPWINGVQNAPGKAIPLHPFAEEQKAAAAAVLAVLPKGAKA